MRTTFEQWLAFQSGLRDTSRRTYRTMAAHFLDWCERRKVLMVDLAPSHLADYMGAARSDNSNAVITGRVNMLRSFFDWAIAQGLMTTNPCQRALLPRLRAAKPQKVPFTYEEYQTILAELTRPDAGYSAWWPSAVRIAWHTGLRCGDVAHLRWDQINFEAQSITVFPRKKQAAGERLEIPIEPDLLSHLSILSATNEAAEMDKQWVLPSMRWQFEDSRTRIPATFRIACDRVGLTGHSFHSLRHSIVTRLLNAGVDSITVGAITGQSVAVVAQYAHISMAAKAGALEASRRAMQSANPQPQLKIA